MPMPVRYLPKLLAIIDRPRPRSVGTTGAGGREARSEGHRRAHRRRVRRRPRRGHGPHRRGRSSTSTWSTSWASRPPATAGRPVQLIGRGKTGVRYFTEVPEKYDGARAGFAIKLAAIPTVVLQIDNAPASLASTGPSRRRVSRAVGKSFRPVGEAFMQARRAAGLHRQRTVSPRPRTPSCSGVGHAELEKIFWRALATDPRVIQANGAAVKGAFAGAKAGPRDPSERDRSDVRRDGRPVILSDGVITPEQAAKGGASAMLYLPAGEAQVAPVPGTAEGKMVFDRMDTGQVPVEKLTWTFRAGKLVAFTAKAGPAFERWKEFYEAAGAGKDAFAGIDLGLHPGVKSPPGKPLPQLHPRRDGVPVPRRRHRGRGDERHEVRLDRLPARRDGRGRREGRGREGRIEGSKAMTERIWPSSSCWHPTTSGPGRPFPSRQVT